MSYKKSNWVPYDPTLSFEQNVTQGGTTTADKLNNMETGIGNAFDKTSDTIGGRNLLIGTGYHTVTGTKNSQGYLSNETTDDFLTLFKGLEGQTVTVSVDYEYSGFVAGSNNNRIGWETQIVADTTPYFGAWYYPNNDSGSGRISYTFVVPKNITHVEESQGYVQFSGSGTGTVSHIKLEKGSIATDWCPNPDDKVNVSDMRKPASDVAGIEEVNAKQDKIGYTPADDSKVVHVSDTANWQKNKVTNDDGTPFIKLAGSSQDLSATLVSLSAGFHTVYANNSVVNSPFNGISSAKGIIDIQANATGSNAFGEGFLIGTKTNQGILMYHVWLDGSKATYTQIANDSTVAHLSGANNFDTVPTVNNNPVATTDDVATASNTVLTSANTSISKLLQSSSNNDEDSAVTNSTSDTSNFYYWTE